MYRLLIILFLLKTTIFFGQVTPKEEFRGAWIATVVNIDFPTIPSTNTAQLKSEWLELIKQFKALNFNALIVQIRPSGDALYPTDLAPWSSYLTGQQGLAPDAPDLLEYMIQTAHERNMEFHAWLNPYRASMNLKTELFAPNHQFFQHPEWFEKYAGKYYFNPALPEVQNHITDIVEEIVRDYDVDAIHFDDYFYPYKSAGAEFPDEEEYQKFGQSFQSKKHFREQQVTQMIEQVGRKIKEIKPYVQFGISPFGVWRNKSDDIRGSDSRAGVKAFDDLHADILGWLQNGTIDYVTPQLYWNIGFAPADYKKLVYWWSEWRYARNLYIGHATYKIANNAEPAWHNPSETSKQIRLNRETFGVQGSVHFSSSKLQNNPLNVLDSLSIQYKTPSKHPEMVWLDVAPSIPPKFDKKLTGGADDIVLTWKNKTPDNPAPYYYIIYRFEGQTEGNYSDLNNVIHISSFGQELNSFTDYGLENGMYYTYAISAVNRAHSESSIEVIRVLKKKGKIKILKK